MTKKVVKKKVAKKPAKAAAKQERVKDDAASKPSGEHWVFHRGALGDSVLLWPILRQWKARGLGVVLVCDRDKGKLAARELGIRAEDAEAARFNSLWVPGAKVEPVAGIAGVVGYLGRAGEGTQVWMANARRMFPNAVIRQVTVRPNRTQAMKYPLPELRGDVDGPVVMHVGAGAEEKRWAMARWVGLATRLRGEGKKVRLIAGEVERERLSEGERAEFDGAGGELLESLEQLAGMVRSARVVVGADSGPGHLAAQMGVPVVSLFGPGDPEKWAPVGPAVEVVAPERPRGMEWLEMERVIGAIERVGQRVFGK